MLTLNALVELLTEKGVLSKPEILERIKKLAAAVPRSLLRGQSSAPWSIEEPSPENLTGPCTQRRVSGRPESENGNSG